MTWFMGLPVVANLALAVAGPRLARVLPPRVAVRLLPASMVVVAAAAGLVLAALGLFAVAQLAPVALLAHWSPAVLRAAQPLPEPFDLVAAGGVAILLGAGVTRAVRGGHQLVRAASIGRRLASHGHPLVVVDDDEPLAYALPGLTGRIVVSTAMVGALDADERHALLAHEAAHLAGRHHLHVQLAEVAAAANPLLRPTALAVRLAVEREADEAAAAEVGDRRLAARALVRAGLAKAATESRWHDGRWHDGRWHGGGRHHGGWHDGHGRGAALAAAEGHLARRTKALLAPAPRPRRAAAVAVLLLTGVSLVGAGVTAHQTDDGFDRALRVAQAGAAPLGRP